MSRSNKNRVASAKTSRGSQHPHGYAGYIGIVQPAADDVQPTVTIDELNRVLKVGQLLQSVLTPDELRILHRECFRYASHALLDADYVSLSILDEELGVADDVRKLDTQRGIA